MALDARQGGFIFGAGEVSVAAGGSGSAPTTAPRSAVRAAHMQTQIAPAGAGTVASDILVEAIRFDDADVDIAIGSDDSGPSSLYLADSIVNPWMGYQADPSSEVTVTYSSTGTTDLALIATAFTTASEGASGRAVEQGKPWPGKRPDGRVIHMGAAASTGEAFSGTPRTQVPLRLLHLVVQAVSADLLASRVAINDDDYLTGGTVGVALFRADCNLFSYRRRVVDKSDTLIVTLTSGTSDTNSAGITAEVA